MFANFIVQVFPPNTGLAGLMLAAILAAAMSTLSSSLNSSASALVNDFYINSKQKPSAPEHLFNVTRLLTIVFGVLQIMIAIWARGLDSTVVTNALTIAGFSAGMLLGVFALGTLTSRAGQAAALIGAAAGLSVLLYLQFLAPKQGIVVAFPWFALIGATTTFLTGYLVSLIVPKKEIAI